MKGGETRETSCTSGSTTEVHYHESRLCEFPESMSLNFVYCQARRLGGILRDRRRKEYENDDDEKKRRMKKMP